MGVFKEIAKADGSGITTFYRLSSEEDTVETTSTNSTSTMTDYNTMLNKPSINDVALVGNKTLEDLGIQPAGDYLTAVPEEYITEEELASSDYATKQYVLEQINHIEHFSREVVEALPITGKSNVIYLVPKEKTNGDVYNEYIWTGADYELIGTTSPDLTIFYTKEEVDGKLDKKVTKVDGKDLSTNDYTTAEKTKLAGLKNYDDSELRNAINALHNYDDTEVRQDITTLEARAIDLETSTNQLETDIVKKATLVRLVKSGDEWSWQDIEGNNITFTQAHETLGHQDAILVFEDIENDGKFIPLIYVSSGDEIHTFFMNDDKTLHALTGNDTLEDMTLGYFTTYNNSVDNVAVLQAIDGLHGEVRRVKDTNDFYIYDDEASQWLPFDKGAVVDLSNYLPKDNTIPYAPSTDYNPATKRYVDTEIDALFIPTKVSQLNNDSSFVNKSTTALENYYTKTNTYTKREVDALLDTVGGGSGVSDYNELTSQPSINNITLTGNKTLADLGIQPAGNYLTSVPEEYVTADELSTFDYSTKAYADNAATTAVANIPVASESANGLMTSTDKTKLDTITQITMVDDWYNDWSYEAEEELVYVRNGNVVNLYGSFSKFAGSAAASFTSVPDGWEPAREFYYYPYTYDFYGDQTTSYYNPVYVDTYGYIWISNNGLGSSRFDGFSYIVAPYSAYVASEKVCFDKDTIIYGTENKAIKDLQIGDKVYAFNHHKDQTELVEVTNIKTHEGLTDVVRIIAGGKEIICTPDHNIFTVEGIYTRAKSIKPGFHLFTADKEEISVESVEEITMETIGYDIDTRYHNYFVGEDKILAQTEKVTSIHD